MRVHALAQVELDAERDAPGDQPPRDGQREAQDARGEHGDAERGELRLVARADLVDRAAGERGIATVITIAAAASSPEAMTPRAVWTQEAEQPDEGRQGSM